MDEILDFTSSGEFRAWLEENHSHSDRVWLRLSKKGATQPSITYAEALDQALCFGWIDGQKKSYDASAWLQRFSRRRPPSNWSRINTQHAQRLIDQGLMHAAGLAEIATAQADGRWTTAYDSPRNATLPADFLAALRKDKAAQTFFKSLNKANLYAIAYRLQTARRPETRQRRLEKILAMLSRGEAFHP